TRPVALTSMLYRRAHRGNTIFPLRPLWLRGVAARPRLRPLLRPGRVWIHIGDRLHLRRWHHRPDIWPADRLVARVAAFEHRLVDGGEFRAALLLDRRFDCRQTGGVDGFEDARDVDVLPILPADNRRLFDQPLDVAARLIE